MTRRWLVSLVGLSLTLAACGPAAKPAGPAVTPGAPAETRKQLGKVTIVQSVATLSFAPMYIADAKKYFADEGVEANLVVVSGGGAEAAAAMAGKSAEFAAMESSQVVQMTAKGIDIVAVQSNVNAMTMSFIVNKKVAERLSLSSKLPLEDRLKQLKGLTIGTTGPGAATDTYTRLYLRRVGINPDTEAKIVAIGGGPELSAALTQGQIDAFQLSPPTPQQLESKGVGVVIINTGDVPELRFPYEVLATRREYMEKNPEMVRAVARAVARANNFILDHPAEAAKLLELSFPKVEPQILSTSLKSISPAIPRDGLMEQAGWENLAKIMGDAKQLKDPFDAKPEKNWTNKYLMDVKGLSDPK